MLTIEEVVTQLHQEVITLKAQVADQTGVADAVRAKPISRQLRSHRCEGPRQTEGKSWQGG